MVSELRPLFVKVLAARVAEMRGCLERGDPVVFRRTVHQIAGSGASFGHEALTEEGRKLEAALAGGGWAAGCEAFVALCEQVLAVEQAVVD